MIRTQIQITPEQARALKRLASKEGTSVAELIRRSVDAFIQTGGIPDQVILRARALSVAGKLSGPADLAARHDEHLAEAFEA
jgi:hypothetical protein